LRDDSLPQREQRCGPARYPGYEPQQLPDPLHPKASIAFKNDTTDPDRLL
jgi:hypothetical protein